MYDNVHLWLCRHIGNAQQIAGRNNGVPIVNRATGEIKGYQWHARNLRVSLFSNGVSVKGSLPKYLFGDNVHTLDRADTAEAFGDISQMIGFDIAEAKVSYLEFGQTFMMQRPPVDYFEKLGDGGRWMPRQQVGTTLYYGRLIDGAPKVLSFYDKAAEMQRKGGAIPPLLDGANLLRYELRLHGSLGKYGITTAGDLTNKMAWGAVKREYVTSYNKITKYRVMADVEKPNKDWVLANLMASHPEETEALLKKVRGVIPRQSFSRLKRRLLELRQTASANKDELLQELDDAIMSV